jgi:hypothetical protein
MVVQGCCHLSNPDRSFFLKDWKPENRQTLAVLLYHTFFTGIFYRFLSKTPRAILSHYKFPSTPFRVALEYIFFILPANDTIRKK